MGQEGGGRNGGRALKRREIEMTAETTRRTEDEGGERRTPTKFTHTFSRVQTKWRWGSQEGHARGASVASGSPHRR